MTPQEELETIKATIRQVIAETVWLDEDITGRCNSCSGRPDYGEDQWTVTHGDDCPYTKLAKLVGLSNVQVSERR